jgi:hypothetical protein
MKLFQRGTGEDLAPTIFTMVGIFRSLLTLNYGLIKEAND